MSDVATWSDALARGLLDALSDEEIASAWGLTAVRDRGRLRGELCAWARDDSEVRRWIVAAWRERHEAVVDETESYAPEELAERVSALCERFGAEGLLLALLTDEAARGTDLADALIAHVTSAKHRQILSGALRRLMDGAGPAPAALKRVVVFGGHPRDAANLDEPLSDLGPFEIRWETFERNGAGGSADVRSVTAALAGADAAIVVIGMASHALASLVKSQAQAYGIPCRTIDKTTRRRLTESLGSLFPGEVPQG